MEQFGIEVNVIVETDLSVDEFSEKFIEWVESNSWVCGGSFKPVDEEGNMIKNKK
jgi:hypothetical protein